ncbi:MAG TPA: GNAT family N-acetyltransferase [Anaerolineales bacterium]|nr:GNAT family N-acetyltransferase [Anaerolineales bacterium]
MSRAESKPSEPTIRPAVSSDIPGLLALEHNYSTDHVWQMGYHPLGEEVNIAFREVRLPRPMRVTYPRSQERLADEWTQAAILLVAESAQGLLGYLILALGPAPETGWVTDLVVDLPHRRQGVATGLLGVARRWCLEQDVARMVLEMQSKNFPCICLARKLGFVLSGYHDRYYPDQDIALFFTLNLR